MASLSLTDRIVTAFSEDQWWWAGEILKERSTHFLHHLENVLYAGGGFSALKERVVSEPFHNLELAVKLGKQERHDNSARARRFLEVVSAELRRRNETPRSDMPFYGG